MRHPLITLEGTVEDWKSILRRVQELRRFELDFWVNALEPILEKIVATAAGTVDQAFWGSIYKWDDARGSGSPHASGWILNLFPYLDNPRTKMAWQLAETFEGNENVRRQYAERLGGPRLIRNPWLGIAGLWHEGPGRDDFPHAACHRGLHSIGSTSAGFFPCSLSGASSACGKIQRVCACAPIGWAVLESPEAQEG